MTLFWIAVAVMLALALALLLPTLARSRAADANADTARQRNLEVLREQIAQVDAERATGLLDADQHRLAREEIERRALDEESIEETPTRAPRATRTAVLVALAVPVLAFGLYAQLGNREALQVSLSAAPNTEVTQAQVEEMVEQLARKMETQAGKPDELQGWVMLARSYAALQRFPEASRAYGKATALAPDNAQLLADHADVLTVVQRESAAGEPTRLIERALQIDPDNLKALALAGSAAMERRDPAAAVAYWNRARERAPADSEFARNLDRSIAEVTGSAPPQPARATSPASPPSGPTVPKNQQAAASEPASAAVVGVVKLAPALLARIAPADTVFIVARAAEGPRMPLAILKRTAAELPITFRLDDSSAMSPDFTLSKFQRVVVSARISKSGEAMPRTGDLVGQSVTLTPGTAPLELLIDGVQP